MLSVHIVKVFEVERFVISLGICVKPSLILSNEHPSIVFICLHIPEPVSLKEMPIQVIPTSKTDIPWFM